MGWVGLGGLVWVGWQVKDGKLKLLLERAKFEAYAHALNK